MISEIEKKLAILDKELHSILNIIKAKREYDVESEIRDFRKLVSDIKKIGLALRTPEIPYRSKGVAPVA